MTARANEFSSSVTHVVPAIFDLEAGTIGGAERYAMELARWMARRTPTRLVSFSDHDEVRRVGDLEIELLAIDRKQTHPGSPIFSFALFDLLEKAEIVHCHQLLSVSTSLSAAFAIRKGIPVFVTDLGGGPSANYCNPDTADWFDAHLHISRFSKRRGERSERSIHEIIGAGVDLDKFSPSNVAPLPDHVLFVGRILPHKGVDILIDALPQGMTLTILGTAYDESYYSDLQQIARDKRVRFVTNSTDEILVDEYCKATVVVLPSVSRSKHGEQTPAAELLGQTLLEAMASARPAICTNVGGMPEVVEDGVTGFVVPEGDSTELRAKLEWVRDHAALAIDMGKRGRQRVEQSFTWDAVVSRCFAAYARTLEHRDRK